MRIMGYGWGGVYEDMMWGRDVEGEDGGVGEGVGGRMGKDGEDLVEFMGVDEGGRVKGMRVGEW